MAIVTKEKEGKEKMKIQESEISSKEKFSVSIYDLEEKPKLLTDFLRKNEKISLILERDKKTNEIKIGMRKVYDEKVLQMLESAKRKHALKKEQGYTGKQAIKEFRGIQQEISKELNKK